MTLEEIKEVLRRAILQIQIDSGRLVPEIHDELRPIGDLEGFDSLNAVEASCLLSEYLAHNIPNDIMLPAQGGKQLTISEIADRLYQIIGS